MIINCSGCGKPTTPKQIEKGINGPWTAYECSHGCMKPGTKYKLTTKPPKAPYQGGGSGGVGSGEVVELLRKIHLELVSIRLMVNSKTTLAGDPLEKQVEEPF